jgi:hypothetical protein
MSKDMLPDCQSPMERITQKYDLKVFHLPLFIFHQMMILFYENGVRICIGTANLIPGDWLFKTQGFWVRDFPLKQNQKNATASTFEKDLLTYLSKVGFLDYTKLKAFNFSSANVTVLHSFCSY